ncbi:hypothetical protein CsatA_006611 [Cannabis sativa]
MNEINLEKINQIHLNFKRQRCEGSTLSMLFSLTGFFLGKTYHKLENKDYLIIGLRNQLYKIKLHFSYIRT